MLQDASPIKPEMKLLESGTRCTDVLSDTLSGYAGINQADFDLDSGSLRVSYAPRVLSDEYADGSVRRASERAYGRVTHCAQKNEAACAACTAEMAGTLRQHYQRLAKFQEASQAIFRRGLMEIRLPYSGSPDLEIYQAEANPVTAPVETPARKGIGRS